MPRFAAIALAALLAASAGSAADASFLFAGLSLTPEPWNKQANLAKLERYAREAPARGANVIATPEGFLEGYVGNEHRTRDHQLTLRIGMNTGPAVAGIIGFKKFAYDLWGDTINVASRMETAGVPGKIQVSERVYELLKGKFVNVESEMAALAYVTGASIAGVRVFTATSSQGLAWMHEGLHWAAGARLPIVLVNVNRPLGAPWNLTCEQTDSLSQRDTGWMQFYCESNQEVLDTVIPAGVRRHAGTRRVTFYAATAGAATGQGTGSGGDCRRARRMVRVRAISTMASACTT